MNIKLGIILFTLVISATNAQANNRLISPDLGFSMEIPVSNSADSAIHQLAVFFLPTSDGFSANVNVQKQKFVDSIKTYDQISTVQLNSMGLTIISREMSDNMVVYEYTGDAQGRSLHWYAKAIKNGSYVYLVTATGLESKWPVQKQELMKAIDSFQLTQ